ncbi:MAG: phosphoribosyl-ATP diphosphatase [Halioglobus sp.]
MNDVLAQLANTLAARRHADPEQSYVASLHHRGLNKILEKVGEESTEVIVAAKDAAAGGSREAVVGEVADLWFHSMVLLSHLGLEIEDVIRCLGDRQGVSGHDEKAARNTHGK